MPHLILIRHANSQPVGGTSPHHWQLSNEGRRQCALLAERLRPYNITHLYSSDEPKALQTAGLIGSDLGHLPSTLDDQLRETRRENAPFYDDETTFRQAIHAAMNQPQQLLYGEEAFDAARVRFAKAVNRIVAKNEGTVALLSHGTILSLYIASMIETNPFDIWKLLDMPAYAVFSLPDMKICEICYSLDNI